MLQAVCDSCIRRSSRRETRVQCTRPYSSGRICGAHRILELNETCFVCGSYTYQPVPPSQGDLPALYADLALALADIARLDDSPEAAALIQAFGIAHTRLQRTEAASYPMTPVDPWSAI